MLDVRSARLVVGHDPSMSTFWYDLIGPQAEVTTPAWSHTALLWILCAARIADRGTSGGGWRTADYLQRQLCVERGCLHQWVSRVRRYPAERFGVRNTDHLIASRGNTYRVCLPPNRIRIPTAIDV